MLSGKRIILGVTGGIAAYKAAFLLRALQKAGAEVRVTMTPAATHFVGSQTFASLSRHGVATDIFPEDDSDSESWTRHISWGEWADLFLITPCTAHTLAKIAHGFSDNMLTATVLAARCPLLICPTMDGGMYDSPAVQRNLSLLDQHGYHLLPPEEGYLASGLEDKGRLPEIATIVETCSSLLSEQDPEGPLSGKKVVVTAGPTREFIDPVRFISNPSSGKMGFAMAEAARALGAEVLLIHGPVGLVPPAGIETKAVTSAEEMFQAVQSVAEADVFIMAAAVSDYTPEITHEQKVKKRSSGNKALNLPLRRTTDILAWLGSRKKKEQILIGFAMETENLLENAQEKLQVKKANYIVANSLNEEDAGFDADTNTVEVLFDDSRERLSGSKKEVAHQILAMIFTEN